MRKLESIKLTDLAAVSGGMKWEQLPRSTNIEDRRPKWAIERDDKWFREQGKR